MDFCVGPTGPRRSVSRQTAGFGVSDCGAPAAEAPAAGAAAWGRSHVVSSGRKVANRGCFTGRAPSSLPMEGWAGQSAGTAGLAAARSA
eukprot:5594927-Heterocapsa_arctica.AAC.1